MADMESPEDGSDATEADTATAVTGKPARGRMTRGLVAVALVAVLAAGYGGWLLVQRHRTDVAAAQALAAAEQYALTLTNIDAVNVEQNFTDIAAGFTGEFQTMHTNSRTTLRRMLVDANVTARGTVVDSAVKSATTDTVVVVLLIDQSVTNRDVSEPQIDRSRIRMTMDNVDGQWLARKVELL